MGAKCLLASIYKLRGDYSAAQNQAPKKNKSSQLHTSECEIMYVRAGPLVSTPRIARPQLEPKVCVENVI